MLYALESVRRRHCPAHYYDEYVAVSSVLVYICFDRFIQQTALVTLVKYRRAASIASFRGTGPLSQRSAIAKVRYGKGPGLGLGLVCRSRLQFKKKIVCIQSSPPWTFAIADPNTFRLLLPLNAEQRRALLRTGNGNSGADETYSEDSSPAR